MIEITTNINWLAVVVGAVIAYLVGWIWYSPKVFGAKWMEGVGVSGEGETKPPLAPMITQAIATFLLAWVVGVTATHNALHTIILIVVTIVALVIAGGLFSQKSCYAIGVEAGYIVVMAAIMIVTQIVL